MFIRTVRRHLKRSGPHPSRRKYLRTRASLRALASKRAARPGEGRVSLRSAARKRAYHASMGLFTPGHRGQHMRRPPARRRTIVVNGESI